MNKNGIGWQSCILIIICAALGFVFAGVISKSFIGILIPLLLAYVAARIVRPSALFISRACHVNEKAGGAVYAVIVAAGFFYLITVLSGKLIGQLWSLMGNLPHYAEEVVGIFGRLYEKLPFKLNAGDDGSMIKIMNSAVSEAASYVAGEAAGFLSSAVRALPGNLMSVFVTVIGFIYLTSDMNGAGESIAALLPVRYSGKITSAFRDAAGAVFSYLRAYATIMTVTFVLLAAGFYIIGTSNPLAAALIIAVIDALPVLGCGSVMVPWAMICFLSHDAGRGIGLLILLAAVYIVRQFVEPRVIGKMTGAHPFVALASVFIGWKTGGICGMIFAPIVLMCFIQIKKNRAAE